MCVCVCVCVCVCAREREGREKERERGVREGDKELKTTINTHTLYTAPTCL